MNLFAILFWAVLLYLAYFWWTHKPGGSKA